MAASPRWQCDRAAGASGGAIQFHGGVITDEDGRPVPNVLIETWHATGGRRQRGDEDRTAAVRRPELHPPKERHHRPTGSLQHENGAASSTRARISTVHSGLSRSPGGFSIG